MRDAPGRWRSMNYVSFFLFKFNNLLRGVRTQSEWIMCHSLDIYRAFTATCPAFHKLSPRILWMNMLPIFQTSSWRTLQFIFCKIKDSASAMNMSEFWCHLVFCWWLQTWLGISKRGFRICRLDVPKYSSLGYGLMYYQLTGGTNYFEDVAFLADTLVS